MNLLFLDFVAAIFRLSGIEEEDDGDGDDDDGGEEVVKNGDDDPSLSLVVSFDSISQLETTTNHIHRLIFLLFPHDPSTRGYNCPHYEELSLTSFLYHHVICRQLRR